MKKHFKYLWYILRHKWFVLVAGVKIKRTHFGGRKNGVGIWRLLVHDMSKFRPSEWFPYARYFYGDEEDPCGYIQEAFDRAWLAHIHRNPHHWQHWILQEDDGPVKILAMPFPVLVEMVADWMGAGRAITGKWDTWAWYDKNKDLIKLAPLTRPMVAVLLIRMSKET